MKRPVRSGLDQLLSRPRDLRRMRVGLIANPASVTAGMEHSAQAIRRSGLLRLRALFGPEHGVWANAQDLVEVPHGEDPLTGLPVYSLYGKTRKPSAKMLDGLDALLFDIQDVGARYYTFVYTMLLAMEACAEQNKKLIVLDRPNPLGGIAVQGNVLEPSFRSFVGMHPIAARHGMTVGELALMFRAELKLEVDLRVIRMRGWKRGMGFEEAGLPWVMPSPNMPTLETAHVYPGACLVEGTNLSEGRGTTRPFELVGAPWIDPWRLARDLKHQALPGVKFRPTLFSPAFQKHAGVVCGGVQVHVTNRRLFQPFLAYLLLIVAARRQDPKAFAWRKPPYEYEAEKAPFDILCGTDRVRLAIENGRSPRTFGSEWASQVASFKRRRSKYLLY
jgi:uncharacterized protein YbbC (DUF1343 family)